ncbi:zf-HC2 domain-containing protein [Streptomyces boncukensis]|uniref:Zf-HC2 domain-containing protein n=1 Tax=Streptomyces boncukensis TaxID=2711219 RepID=A0A6G4WXB0_9ACTN|nr:zf-HC2 domain-containing protein [Streptomyces boncukensis]
MTPAEHHLGDRLAALVDGELGHDARERVLAHLATCRSCKAEADEQRRLKNVFADTAPPPPSEGLLARLQGLPAGGTPMRPDGWSDPGDPDQGPGGTGAEASADAGDRGGLPTARTGARSPWDFDYLPVSRGGSRSALGPHRGFRIHESDREERAERSASRGRRLAFAAAGAFSLAALAIGGAFTTGAAGGPSVASGDRADTSAGPVRSASPGGAGRDGRRRAERGGEQRARVAGVLSASAAASLSSAAFSAGGAGSSPARGDRSTGAPPALAPQSSPLLSTAARSSGALLRPGGQLPGSALATPAPGPEGWSSQWTTSPSRESSTEAVPLGAASVRTPTASPAASAAPPGP